MPSIKINQVELFYTDTGEGKATVVLSHGLLWDHRMFDKQVEVLKSKYRVIAFDHRGQGKSSLSNEEFDMDDLTEDARELIIHLVGSAVHFVGLSMGGFVGMRLAARYPELIKSLVLLETSANAEPVENIPKYKMLNGTVKWFGVLPMVAQEVMKILFAQSWLENPKNKTEVKKWFKILKSNKKSIARSVDAVMSRSGIEDEIRLISSPTMIIAGDEDVATKPEKAKFIQMSIPNATLHMIPGAGHSSTIEKPHEVNKLLLDWLDSFK
ncbi:alpha/beta fold hydrolase [Belliella kenyensis]|uniref:Alpha/beta fold hydrolase n=1 Tax=Belliella kenyensis TaxID=1472724 RepID=A0ABV8ENX7_9BACT|nr:alpha/beta hydrolase [Belliella kenyensis]MCH7400598.1 alpha/beta hydrolase [Belliella kenyensis]MDN3602115.1 alpha/beta hydrolase [Belliella kenyensis]